MTIRLKNISTYKLINQAKGKKDFDLVYKEIYDWLMINKIDNYQKLKQLLFKTNNGLSSIATKHLLSYFNTVLNRLTKANEEEKGEELFTFPCYDKLDLDKDVLEYTDNNTKGGILLLGSPINKTGFVTLTKLDEFSITDIKYLLGVLSSTDLRNGLTTIKYLRSVECSEIVKLVKSYEQQVIRQYFETDRRDVNLFKLNSETKKQIVRENINKIIEYIITKASDECIWGIITPNQKRLLETIINPNSRGDNNEILELLIERIANYTTLGELETGILKKQEVVTLTGNKIKRKSMRPIERFFTKKKAS